MATPRPALTLCAVLLAGACARAPYPLSEPEPQRLAAVGPDSFDVRFLTSRGAFDVRVHRDWAPLGADRIYYLARSRFYDGVRFFRVVNGRDGKPFVAQFGLNGDSAVSAAWRGLRLQDDIARKSNVRGTLSFAAGGPNTRTTQIYINFGDNSRLDTLRFAVFGQVIRGMSSVVDSLYKGYPEVPSQDSISRQGNAYLNRSYPKLDYVVTARIAKEWKR
ncbi:MAG: peptidylprolyl isomerase [Gemmatimonadetes bacterium]|nr:peptidylprolyl isomerase [Gemmatimonadota bacterium]